MNKLIMLVLAASLLGCGTDREEDKTMNKPEQERPEYVIVIHGGAGSRVPGDQAGDQRYLNALRKVLQFGDSMLNQGADAVDVVEQCLRIMEDDSLFNAGRGAVFAADSTNRLDASIMNGANLNAGAVAGVSRIKNPIRAARLVMDSSVHVFLSGAGAEEFAVSQGMKLVDPSYFFTQENYDRLIRARKDEQEKHGTVGCVVLDKKGHLAAGTSTGGMTNKKYDRIGDSPIIGAGTYAEDSVCAVSATGHGEYFIRYVVAHDIAARMKYSGMSLDDAARSVIMNDLKKAGGSGGVICVDYQGNISSPFNTSAMFRGFKKAGQTAVVRIYPE